MKKHITNERTGSLQQKPLTEPPKSFWKYYDLYRRRRITLAEYAEKTGLPVMEIKRLYGEIRRERTKSVEDVKLL